MNAGLGAEGPALLGAAGYKHLTPIDTWDYQFAQWLSVASFFAKKHLVQLLYLGFLKCDTSPQNYLFDDGAAWSKCVEEKLKTIVNGNVDVSRLSNINDKFHLIIQSRPIPPKSWKKAS